MSIIYGGVRYIQVRHAMKCKLCEDTIESKSQHDFKWCKCGAIGVDGGIGCGNRILGDLKNMEDRRMWKSEGPGKRYYLPEEEILRRFNAILNK